MDIIVTMLFFLLFNNQCRMCSAYFPMSRCKKYIYVNNNIFAHLLIAKSISRDKSVNPIYFSKVSIIGLISYICIELLNIFALIIGIIRSIYRR